MTTYNKTLGFVTILSKYIQVNYLDGIGLKIALKTPYKLYISMVTGMTIKIQSV